MERGIGNGERSKAEGTEIIAISRNSGEWLILRVKHVANLYQQVIKRVNCTMSYTYSHSTVRYALYTPIVILQSGMHYIHL